MNNDDWLKSAVDKIDGKLDKLDGRVDAIDITMARNTESLIQHEKRTTLNEQNLELIHKELKPIKAHVYLINTLAKIISAGAGIAIALHELGLF